MLLMSRATREEGSKLPTHEIAELRASACFVLSVTERGSNLSHSKYVTAITKSCTKGRVYHLVGKRDVRDTRKTVNQDLLNGSLGQSLGEIARLIQLQFLDSAEIGIGGREMYDPSAACGGRDQRIVHQKTVPSPDICRTKESFKLERQHVDSHQRNTFDLILVDM
jgi:hypothetical protein